MALTDSFKARDIREYLDATHMRGKNITFLDDFSRDEIQSLFYAAEMLEPFMRTGTDLLKGKVLYTLFFQPSTRTRCSHENAMHRLGGAVITEADPTHNSSVAKNESLADSLRVTSEYADVIVMRHPDDKEAMGAKIIYTGTSELRTPDIVREKLCKMGAQFEEHFDLTQKQHEELYMDKGVDLIYLPGCSVKKDDPNREDFMKKMANYYVSMDMLNTIRAKTGKVVGVHHSLPRNPGEFDFGIDNTPHQLYFRAIGFSVALRMALLSAVVGVN